MGHGQSYDNYGGCGKCPDRCDHCEGDTIRYYRGTTKGGPSIPIEDNIVDFSEERQVGTFPRLPYLEYGGGEESEEGRCYAAGENGIGRTDIIQWRVQNDQESAANGTLASGYCRSLIPVEEVHYGADLSEDQPGNKILDVTGFEPHDKPNWVTVADKCIVAAFDTVPYLRIWTRETDVSYLEIEIPHAPDRPVKLCHVSEIASYGTDFFVIGCCENYPYHYYYTITENVVTRRNFGLEGMGGLNFVRKDFQGGDSKLYTACSLKGELFEYDVSLKRFRSSGRRAVNEYRNQPSPGIGGETFEPMMIRSDGEDFYFLQKSGVGYFYDVSHGSFIDWNHPYGNATGLLVLPPVFIDGAEYQPVRKGLATGPARWGAYTLAGRLFRELPLTGGESCHFLDQWGALATTDRGAFTWEWDSVEEAWREIRFEGGGTELLSKFVNIVQYSETTFLVLEMSETIQVYKLDTILKPVEEWTDPEIPEYEIGWKYFQSLGGPATTSYRNIFTRVAQNQFFIGHSSSASSKSLKRYDAENDVFVDVILPDWSDERLNNHLNQTNIYWSEMPYSRTLYDITFFDNRWMISTDQAILYYEPGESETDETLFTTGQWKHTGWIYPIMDEPPKYYFCQKVGGSDRLWNFHLFSILRGETVYTTLIDVSQDSRSSRNYLPVTVENATSFSISPGKSQTEGYEADTNPQTMTVGTPNGIKSFRWFAVKDDGLGVVSKRWTEMDTPFRNGVSGNITHLQNQEIPLNSIPAGRTGTSYRYVQPPDYLNPNGTANTSVVNNYKFDAGFMFTGLKDGIPCAVVYKRAVKNNEYNAVSSLEYSPNLAVPSTLTGYFEYCDATQMILEYRQMTSASADIVDRAFCYGNEFWVDGRSDTELASQRFWNPRTSGLSYDCNGDRLADFIVVEDGKVQSYHVNTQQPGFEADKSPNPYRLRKDSHREIEAAWGTACGEYAYCITDEEPYISIYKWGPNDGIAWGLPEKACVHPNPQQGTNNFLINLDYRCFKKCEDGQKIWCNPKWKKLIYVPLHTENWGPDTWREEIRYVLDWNTHTNELFYTRTDGERIRLGLRDQPYEGEISPGLFIDVNNPNQLAGAVQINGILAARGAAYHGGIHVDYSDPWGVNNKNGFVYFDTTSEVHEDWRWKFAQKVVTTSSPWTNFRKTYNLVDKKFQSAGGDDWPGSWIDETKQIDHDPVSGFDIYDPNKFMGEANWYYATHANTAFAWVGRKYGNSYSALYPDFTRQGILTWVVNTATEYNGEDAGNVLYKSYSWTDLCKMAGFSDADWSVSSAENLPVFESYDGEITTYTRTSITTNPTGFYDDVYPYNNYSIPILKQTNSNGFESRYGSGSENEFFIPATGAYRYNDQYSTWRTAPSTGFGAYMLKTGASLHHSVRENYTYQGRIGRLHSYEWRYGGYKIVVGCYRMDVTTGELMFEELFSETGSWDTESDSYNPKIPITQNDNLERLGFYSRTYTQYPYDAGRSYWLRTTGTPNGLEQSPIIQSEGNPYPLFPTGDAVNGHFPAGSTAPNDDGIINTGIWTPITGGVDDTGLYRTVKTKTSNTVNAGYASDPDIYLGARNVTVVNSERNSVDTWNDMRIRTTLEGFDAVTAESPCPTIVNFAHSVSVPVPTGSPGFYETGVNGVEIGIVLGREGYGEAST